MNAEFQLLQNGIEKISPISASGMEAMLGLFSPLALAEGECLIRMGESAKYVGFLTRGIMREFFLTDKGKEFNKSFVLPGMFTGSLYDLLSAQASTASVQALSPVGLLIAPYQRCVELFERDISLERLGRKFAEQLFVQKARREYELICLSATQRYQVLLQAHPDIESLISQYHIASYLGITPVSLSRIRRQRQALIIG